MELSEAKQIFKDLENKDIDVEKKLIAIEKVINSGKYSDIAKVTCIRALRWIMEDYL